jgi:hypothetical protein
VDDAARAQQGRDDRERESRGSLEEHLAFCKTRAREYLDQGDWLRAWNSFCSDALKHPDTRRNPMLMQIASEVREGRCTGVEAMRAKIDAFR